MYDLAASTIADHRHRGARSSAWQRWRGRLPVRRLRAHPFRVVSVILGAEELVAVEGVLDAGAAPRLAEALHAAAGRSRVVLDLRRVRSLDREGIEAVIASTNGERRAAIVMAPARRRARRRLERAAADGRVELRYEPVS